MGMSSGHTSCKARKWLDEQKERNGQHSSTNSQSITGSSSSRIRRLTNVSHHFMATLDGKKIVLWPILQCFAILFGVLGGVGGRESHWKQALITNMQRFKATIRHVSTTTGTVKHSPLSTYASAACGGRQTQNGWIPAISVFLVTHRISASGGRGGGLTSTMSTHSRTFRKLFSQVTS